MKLIIGIAAILLPVLSFAQSPAIKPLTLGDEVPDVEITNVYNYPLSSMHLSEFKGKLVILDFWSSWCGACIALFPHLDSLQRRYKDNIQIVLVNTKSLRSKDDESKIKKILSKVQERTGTAIDLPVIYNCPALDEYFPCIMIPHEVWINKEGKVAGITFPEQVIAENIEAFINGKEVHMRLKKDRADIDKTLPLFINGNAGDGSETKYRSLLTGYIDGVGGHTGVREEGGSITGFYSFNQSLLSLVKTAYSRSIPIIENRIVLNVADIKKFNPEYSDSTAYHYQYTYDLMVPPTNDSMVFIYMQQDLERYFNISVKKEFRKMKCLVLSGSGTSINHTPGNKPDFDLDKTTLKKFIYNYPPAEAVRILNIYGKLPVINETSAKGNITVSLPYNIGDTPRLKAAFAANGFTLKEEVRELEVVVITDQ